MKDNTSTFQELLNKDNSVSTHNRNLEELTTEVFKTHRSLPSEILRGRFVSKTSSDNLRRIGYPLNVLADSVKLTYNK